MAKLPAGLFRPKYRAPDGSIKESLTIWMDYVCRGCQRHLQSGRHRESTETESVTRAKRIRDSKVGDAADGKLIECEKITVGQLYELVLNEYKTVPFKATGRLRKTTYKVEQEWKSHLKEFFEWRRAQSLRPSDIDSYKAKRLSEGAAYSTVNNELAVISSCYTLGLKKQMIMSKPFEIERYTVNNARTGIFSEKQFYGLCEHLPNDVAAPSEFEFETSWRGNSETLTRCWSHVDRELGVIYLEAEESKNGKPRVYPYLENERLTRIIEQQWKIHEELFRKGHLCKWVFHHDGDPLFRVNEKQGQKRPSVYFVKAWDKARKAVGLPNAIPHDFRRSAITRYEAQGISRKVAMELSGHASESVFNRYNITSLEHLKSAVRKLNRAVSK